MTNTDRSNESGLVILAANALVIVTLLWAGIILGVSFLATPAKFLAPNLELGVALEVGNRTFMILQKVNLVCLALVVAFVVVMRRHLVLISVSIGLIGLEALQDLWLQPSLHERTLMIIAGEVPSPSSLHEVYALIEAVKALALLAMGGGLLWWLSASTSSQNRDRDE